MKFVPLLTLLAAAAAASPVRAELFEMVRIDGGTLSPNAAPSVKIAPFRISNTELTYGEWSAIRNWALAHGYDFGSGTGENFDYPVSNITWYDAVKFCNAASEAAGLQPVYYTAPKDAKDAKREVYRRGIIDLTGECIDPNANGYRLPTEWEWEFACRAGTTTDYWWGDTSEPLPSNPYAWHTYAPARGEEVSPHPVGQKKPNPFGLYDMSGNVAEWCWDLFWDKANWRVQRGGSVALDNNVTSGFRSPVPPSYYIFDVGMRLVGPADQCPPLREVITAKGLKPTLKREPFKPTYDTKSDEAVAAKLVSLLNPDVPEAAKVIALQKQGKAKEALEAFRDGVIARLRPSEPIKDGPKTPKTPEEIADWFAKAEAQATTGKIGFDNLDNAGRAAPNSYLAPVTWDYGMGFGFWGETWRKFLKKLISEQPADAPPEKVIPARAFANMMIYVATDDIARPIKDPRDCVGNQQIAMGADIIHGAEMLPEMRDAPAWKALGMDRLEHGAVARYILPDGGDLEQSFNYNNALFDSVITISGFFDDTQKPAWVERLHDAAINRRRMFSGLRLASGALPSVGNGSYGRDMSGRWGSKYPAPDPLFDQINDWMLDGNKLGLPEPAFTSIAFPYTGYYLMRNGWSPESSSLFLKSSRPGAGHNHPDNNSIDLCAYGKHLLVIREAPPYQPLCLPEDQRKYYPWFLEYKGEGAPWAANTLLIDGCGQTSGSYTKGYTNTIPNNSWYTSEDFDFVQGVVRRPFKSTPTLPIDEVRENAAKFGATPEEVAKQVAEAEKHNASIQAAEFTATHTRQVIYLRPVNAWIVTDWASREDGKRPSTLTQVWGFPSPRLGKNRGYGEKFGGFSPLHPGFEKEHVAADEKSARVITNNPDNANLAILHAVPGKVKYQTFFGDKYPWRGWANLSPSMVSGYVPAVDLHATFSAEAPIVTVLVPIPQGKTFADRVASFESTPGQDGQPTKVQIRFTDGTVVDYSASDKPQELQAGPAKAFANALVAMTRDRQTNGLVISENGTGEAFTLADGKLKPTAKIDVPAGFSWKSTPRGLIPDYAAQTR